MAESTEKKVDFSALILNVFLVAIVFGVVGWLFTGQYVHAHTTIYVIPAGTSQQLAAGNEIIQFPNELTFTVGDTLVIENRDDAVHAFGPFTILPHTTLTKRFDTARVYQNNCTLHQNKQMTLIVNPANWKFF